MLDSVKTSTTWDRVVPLSLNALALGSFLLIFCSVLLIRNPYLFPLASIFGVMVGCVIAGYSPWQALGLKRSSFKNCVMVPIMTYFIVLPGVLLTALFSEWIYQKLGWAWSPQSMLKDFMALKQTREIIQFGFLAIIVAPMTEEILFRGFLYAWLKSLCSRWSAVMLTAFLFALLHQHGPVFLPLTWLGIVLVLTYEYTGSLWSSIGLHALFNAVTIFVALQYPELVLR